MNEWINDIDRLADAARHGASGRKILPPWHLIDRWDQERWREVIRYVLAAQASGAATIRNTSQSTPTDSGLTYGGERLFYDGPYDER